MTVLDSHHAGDASAADLGPLETLRRRIEHAAHLLPAQGPITVFIHHNTLHAFEGLPFEEGVMQGAETFGCHPYLPESHYRRQLGRGRIRAADIEAALIEDLGDRADELLGFLGTRFQLRKAMLQHPLLTGPTAELRWVVEETEALWKIRPETPAAVRHRLIHDTRHWVMREHRDGRGPVDMSATDLRLLMRIDPLLERFDTSRIEAWDEATWEAFTLHLLWDICRDGVDAVPIEPISRPATLRHRDALREATGADTDQLINDVLIRFCAAFLDQGFADWPLPRRDAGFFASFAAYYDQGLGIVPSWLRPLRSELQRLAAAGITPLASIQESLDLLGVETAEVDAYLSQTLLSLRGFAGMIWQLETRGDRVARPVPAETLVEFIAVRLILERLALAYVARQSWGYGGPMAQLRAEIAKRPHLVESHPEEQRAFLVFQLALLHGWSPAVLHRLSPDQWRRLTSEIEAFSGPTRRRVFHLAYERRYRVEALDAVAAHCQAVRAMSTPAAKSPPIFQMACCIDDREESFRRHVEEVAPQCETFAEAGFYAVAMYYRGTADAHFTPLCPVVVKPSHYVVEEVAYSSQQIEQQRRRRRRTLGTVTHRVHLGSRTFAGGWFAAVFGSLASLPLVMRILFPRATAQFRRYFGNFVRPPAATQLQLERTAAEPGPHDDAIGFRLDEMTAIVERVLCDMGLTTGMSRLILMVGHGSASLNNPHESAYNCGACGGGHGGPNARAWAQMANDPRVRAQLAERGLAIPDDTWFLGAYHNTCDDRLTYFDLDRLPPGHRADFERAAAVLDEARERNAHERCRRFESAPLKQTTEAALKHVENRSEDLSQARPELGHATNALCLVGRREWSRGLFMDRRAFLQSYDPAQDDADCSILTRILQAVIPVCAGINLEYYFSVVDPTGYGCGTKLPHNVTSLLGVMNGPASDLRTGLPWQMVELHEPVRLLFVIETTPAAVLLIMRRNPDLARLIAGHWVQMATLDAATGQIHLYHRGKFELYRPQTTELPVVRTSADWYRGSRDHLGFARIDAGVPT